MDPIDTGIKAGKLLARFIPPAVAGSEEDAERIWKWRLLLAVTVVTNALLTVVHIAWACSLLPGLAGFAMAGEVREIAETQKAAATEILEQRLFDTRLRQCEAVENGAAPAVLQTYATQMFALKKRYMRLTGQAYEVPLCSEI